MKLSINMSKVQSYERPIITNLTMAKQRISEILNSGIRFSANAADDDSTNEPENKFLISCKVDVNILIVSYKRIVKEHNVEYGGILNYAFSIIEKKIEDVYIKYIEVANAECESEEIKLIKFEAIEKNQKSIVETMKSIFEFIFFVYFASPSVSLTIKICRIVATTTHFFTKQNFRYQSRHELYKFIHDNIRLVLENTQIGFHREVEIQYLLVSLSCFGREYFLPSNVLAKHFSIEFDEDTMTYDREEYLSYFSITVLLFYMKSRKRYDGLRRFVERHAIEKIKSVKDQCHNDTEAFLLFFDLVVCPYISDSGKVELAKAFKLTELQLKKFLRVNDSLVYFVGD